MFCIANNQRLHAEGSRHRSGRLQKHLRVQYSCWYHASRRSRQTMMPDTTIRHKETLMRLDPIPGAGGNGGGGGMGAPAGSVATLASYERFASS